jgi:hypothetical protein
MAQLTRDLDVFRSTILMRLWRAVASWVQCHLFVIALGTAGLGALALHISGLLRFTFQSYCLALSDWHVRERNLHRHRPVTKTFFGRDLRVTTT